MTSNPSFLRNQLRLATKCELMRRYLICLYLLFFFKFVFLCSCLFFPLIVDSWRAREEIRWESHTCLSKHVMCAKGFSQCLLYIFRKLLSCLTVVCFNNNTNNNKDDVKHRQIQRATPLCFWLDYMYVIVHCLFETTWSVKRHHFKPWHRLLRKSGSTPVIRIIHIRCLAIAWLKRGRC